MKFEEILPILRDGGHVRRREWDKHSFVYLKYDPLEQEDNPVGAKHAGQKAMAPDWWIDVVADDWEEVTEGEGRDFAWALETMKKGARVKRKSMDFCISTMSHPVTGHFFAHTEGNSGVHYSLSVMDLEATDWISADGLDPQSVQEATGEHAF